MSKTDAPNLTETELDKLRATKNSSEWYHALDDIKATRQGRYPHDWYAKVVVSGMFDKAEAGWKEIAE